MSSIPAPTKTPDPFQSAVARFERCFERLEQASRIARPALAIEVLDASRRLLTMPEGVALLAERAERFHVAGIFDGSDWAEPESLQPQLIPSTLQFADERVVTLECLSLLRWLALAEQRALHPGISSEQAVHFLREALAVNLDYVFDRGTEAARERRTAAARQVFAFIAERVGYDSMLEQLVEEVWRILRQRPVKVDGVKTMITKLAVYLADPETDVHSLRGADRLTSALFGPTQATQYDPGLDAYRDALSRMDAQMLRQEAGAFARSMADTGLVSVYHAVLARWLLEHQPDLLPAALGLSTTGSDTFLSYIELIRALIDEAVHPETCQAIYGLACLLERGILFSPPVAPALWRQIRLPLHPTTADVIRRVFGDAVPPKVHLLAALLNVLGQPFGVGQGHNPTCQSARAISMWAYNDPDYLMQLLAWAARDDAITMHFEGSPLNSSDLPAGLVDVLHLDLDAVSLVLVPHLDRIYQGMGQLADARGEDPHKWINPEFHGWWVGRGFAIAVDVASGRLASYEDFVRTFYASYHPYHNGNQPQIHLQPAGVAVTDSAGRFVGWHAITLIRVALDMQGEMRAYFYNPNNDGGQDWGCGVVVSTEGNGEYFGESSLPFAQLVSRLYIFHYDPLEPGDPAGVPEDAVAAVRGMAEGSWARDRIELGADALQAAGPSAPGSA
jgi:hypothetical protein